jgi:Pin2-interacting protein X1
MSILAEPRRKRKICVDPQNLQWKNDTNKFGQKMLQKLGWVEGQGLGLNNQGMVENIKLKANYTQKGIGADTNDSDRTWIQHHDEFSFLLEKLNAKKAAKLSEKEEESEESDEEEDDPKLKKLCEDTLIVLSNNSKSLEERSKATKTRIHYKFTQMKDITRYSEKDKSAVIGVGLKSKTKEEDGDSKEESPDKNETFKTTFEEPAAVKNSEVSVNDYFAAKMAKFYAKKTGTVVEEKIEIFEENTIIVKGEVNEEAERLRRKDEKKALKKAKLEANVEILNEVEETTTVEVEDEEERRRKKKERKEQRRKEREARALAE